MNEDTLLPSHTAQHGLRAGWERKEEPARAGLTWNGSLLGSGAQGNSLQRQPMDGPSLWMLLLPRLEPGPMLHWTEVALEALFT